MIVLIYVASASAVLLILAAFATGTMFAISPSLRQAAVALITAIIRPPPRDP